MNLLQTVVTALLQGLTEFLPVSSSGHLVLLPHLLGWRDQGLAFDVAVHVGTLAAVVVYFRAEVRRLVRAWLGSLAGAPADRDARLAWGIVLATVPVGLAGLLFHSLVEAYLRSPQAVAWPTIGFGLLLGWAALRAVERRDEATLTWRDALLVGLAQVLALIPGTSRSGITMTAGLMLGLDRAAAARFSFLLAIPVIVLAGGLETVELAGAREPVAWGALAVGVGVSAVSAYLCIDVFLRLLARIGYLPFVVYRVALGVVLLLVFP